MLAHSQNPNMHMHAYAHVHIWTYTLSASLAWQIAAWIAVCRSRLYPIFHNLITFCKHTRPLLIITQQCILSPNPWIHVETCLLSPAGTNNQPGYILRSLFDSRITLTNIYESRRSVQKAHGVSHCLPCIIQLFLLYLMVSNSKHVYFACGFYFGSLSHLS